MNIGFLTSEFPHPKTGSSGGIGTSILNLSNSLIALKHKVTIYVYCQQEDEIIDDVFLRIVRIKNVQLKGLSWWLTRKKIEHIINKDVEAKRVSIIEAADWTGITAWIKFKCPLVVRLHGSDTYFCNLENRKVKFWNKLQEKTAFKTANEIIAVSKFVGDQSNKVFQTQRNFTVIPNGINTSLFEPKSMPLANKNVILYFGTLIRKKGVFELAAIFNEVVKKIPTAQLMLIGSDASDIHTLSASTWQIMQKQFTKEALLHVNYIGKVPYSEIKTHISNANVCVFPSFAEACPVSWLEAMAMGKALVTSDIGWSSEIIDNGIDGFTCNPKNHQEYANAIISILQNDSIRKRIEVKAREKILTQFDSNIIAQKSLSIYQKYLNHAV